MQITNATNSTVRSAAASDYLEFLDETLRPKPASKGLVLDLFAGCGGLALGFEAAGFETIGFEYEENCCQTYSLNLSGNCNREFLDVDTVYPSNVDIVIGGPPCQPFSVGGLQEGINDPRNGFPAFISAIRRTQPSLWVFENVRGLLYRNKEYFSMVLNELSDLGYNVEYRLLNAKSYLVPQQRERVIVVGHRNGFNFPPPSDRLIAAGEAIGHLATQIPPGAKFLNKSQDQYIAKYELASKCTNPRDLDLGRPARTLTCRNLAGATGDMQRVKLEDGRRRRLSVEEAALLQSFPRWFKFSGKESHQFNQIGNAVPPMFSYQIANAVAEALHFPPTSAPTRSHKIPVQLNLMM